MVKLRGIASRNKPRELLGTLNQETDMAISSQAWKQEGSTTIPKGSRAKRLQARGTAKAVKIWSELHGNMQQLDTSRHCMVLSLKPISMEDAMQITLEVVERFHEKWQMCGESSCWLWTGAKAAKGYGQMKIPGTRKQVYAHRLSYMIHVGPIPQDKHICHTCDNPNCVRPSHLFLGDSKANHLDMKNKRRHLFGEKNAKAKLNEAMVRHCFRLSLEGVSQGRIARVLGVSQGHVWRILHGKRWNHLDHETAAGKE